MLVCLFINQLIINPKDLYGILFFPKNQNLMVWKMKPHLHQKLLIHQVHLLFHQRKQKKNVLDLVISV
jgi:hypothetical protein